MDSKKPYLPKVRTNYSPTEAECQSSVNGGAVNIPDPVNDPIVSNNIAWMEFDYTEDPLDPSSIEDTVSQGAASTSDKTAFASFEAKYDKENP